MTRLIAALLVLTFSLIHTSSIDAQTTIAVKYKKFVVPTNRTNFGRWKPSPEQLRMMRERQEHAASNVKSYYDLLTDGRKSSFVHDTTITLKELEDEWGGWWGRMKEYHPTYAKDLAAGHVTERHPILEEDVCTSHDFREKYNWKSIGGSKVFADMECRRLYHVDEEGDSTFVWYAVSIPIQDGPETFGGAPGLILAVEAPTFNFIAEEITQSDESIDIHAIDPEKCIEEKEFREMSRDKIMKEAMKSREK